MGDGQDALELTASYSQDMISVHDLKGRFKYASPACTSLFGWEVDEVLGRSCYEFIHPDDIYRTLSKHAEHTGEEVTSTKVRLRWICKDGQYRWVDVTTRGHMVDGTAENVIVVCRAVEDEGCELTRMRSEILLLQAKAEKDRMTGLWSKEASKTFLSNLARLTNGAAVPLVVILGDIDHFKRVNDEFGHHAGDQVIKVVSSIFLDLTRRSDLVGRFGGEEFIIALPNCDEGGAERLVQAFQRALRDTPFTKVGHPITLSYGAYVLRDLEPTEETLEKVDRAMYRAKRQGRDRLVFY